MTYDPNTPNAAQSPGLFPAGNNTNFTRLKTIINSEHVFNDTAQADDGAHRQCTLVNRADPVSVPAGTNSMLYGKEASDGINELWFYDAVTPRQLNWRISTGTVSVSSSYATILALPANCYGTIFMYKSLLVQTGSFVSDGTTVNGFSTVEKFEPGTGSDYLLRLGMGSEASGLNLRVKTNISSANGTSTTGTWNYIVQYRLL